MSLNKLINEITEYLKENKPKYLYNQNFIPNQSSVLYSGPFWDENEVVAAIKSLLNSNWLVSGENVFRFERAFAKKFGVKFAHMVNSGSSANLILITAIKKYFGWEDGDEIIVSPVGFPTTISPIVQNNLVPVFVDIEYNTLNFDVNLIESKITERTKAIFVSPVLGNPPDIDFLKELCEKHNLKLLGDSCDSLGTKWNGEDLSKNYVAWTTSFIRHTTLLLVKVVWFVPMTKNLKNSLLVFLGGVERVIVWGRPIFYLAVPVKTDFQIGLESYNGIIDHKYVFTNMGYNLKPMDLQGSIGLIQLEKFDEIDQKRKNSKNRIEEIILKHVHGVKNVNSLDKSDTCWFGTPFICENKQLKDKLVAFLEDNKIQTRNYFAGNILYHPAYKHLGNLEDFPNSNMVLDKVFFLGAAPHYNEDVFNYIDEIFEEKWKN